MVQSDNGNLPQRALEERLPTKDTYKRLYRPLQRPPSMKINAKQRQKELLEAVLGVAA